MIRQEISRKLDAADGHMAEQTALMDTVSKLIYSELEEPARRQEGSNECLQEAIWEYAPCLEPSMRQLNTAQWFVEQICAGNREAAFHYINEYADNYKSGWYTECSGYELQVVWIMLQLLIKL